MRSTQTARRALLSAAVLALLSPAAVLALLSPAGALASESALASSDSATPTAPLQQEQLFPATGVAAYAWRSWQAAYAGVPYDEEQRLTWPDATLWTVGPLDGSSAGPFETDATILDPWGGTVDRRRLDDRVSRGFVVAVDGQEWSVRQSGFRPRYELVARDVRGQVLSARPLPKRVGAATLVPTRDGLRIVAARGRTIVLLDRRMRRVSTWQPSSPKVRDEYLVIGNAEPLTDGSVVVQAIRWAGKPSRSLLIRLSPGRPARVLWGEQSGSLGPLVRADGAVIAAGSSGIVAITDAGRVRVRSWAQLGLPGCGTEPRAVTSGNVLTNGRALFGLRCATGDGQTRTALEVDARGRIAAHYALASYGSFDPLRRSAAIELPFDWSTLPDGSIPSQYSPPAAEDVQGEHANGWITWRPSDWRAPVRGALRVRKDRTAGVLVDVTCRAPYGQRCSGVAEVRAAGEVVGSVRYSLPARPGRAAARDALPVALSAAPVGALTVTAAPLPARPVLNPPRPAWDGSIPSPASASPRP